MLRLLRAVGVRLTGPLPQPTRRHLSAVLGHRDLVPAKSFERSLIGRPRYLGIRGQPTRAAHQYEPHRPHIYSLTDKIRIISTLKRENLQTGDFIELSNKTAAVLWTSLFNELESGIQIKSTLRHGHPLGRFRLRYHEPYRFPKDTKGFLYYYIPPEQSPIAGELRFRVTPTSDPGSFNAEHDLTLLNGFYWRIQLPWLPEPLRNLALRDQLITPDVVAECKRIANKTNRSKATLLYYLEQPFFVDFPTAIST